MEKEIKNLTQKDIDLHNATSKILGEEDNPEICLDASKGFEHNFKTGGVVAPPKIVDNVPCMVNPDEAEMITVKEVPFTNDPDGYRIAELVNILDKIGYFNKYSFLVKRDMASKLYPLLGPYFSSLPQEKILKQKEDIDILNFKLSGLEIKLRKFKEANEEMGESYTLLHKENAELTSSRKLLHTKVIEQAKHLKKAIELINLKDKTIVRLATRLVNKG